MTFTVALLILALGVLIGHHLHRPLAALKAFHRRHRYKWQVLRPWTLDTSTAPAATTAVTQAPTDLPRPSRPAPPHA